MPFNAKFVYPRGTRYTGSLPVCVDPSTWTRKLVVWPAAHQVAHGHKSTKLQVVRTTFWGPKRNGEVRTLSKSGFLECGRSYGKSLLLKQLGNVCRRLKNSSLFCALILWVEYSLSWIWARLSGRNKIETWEFILFEFCWMPTWNWEVKTEKKLRVRKIVW